MFTTLIENLKQEIVGLKNKIKVNANNQYSRSNTTEVHGMPEAVKEDEDKVVTPITAALDMEITRNSINICHKLRKKVQCFWDQRKTCET